MQGGVSDRSAQGQPLDHAADNYLLAPFTADRALSSSLRHRAASSFRPVASQSWTSRSRTSI